MTMFARLKKKSRQEQEAPSQLIKPSLLPEGRKKWENSHIGSGHSKHDENCVTWHNSSIRSPNANYHMTIHEASCIKKHPKRRIPEENFRAAETGRNSQERRSTFLFINNWQSFEGRLLAQKSLVLVLIYVSSTFHFPQTSHSSSRLFRS